MMKFPVCARTHACRYLSGYAVQCLSWLFEFSSSFFKLFARSELILVKHLWCQQPKPIHLPHRTFLSPPPTESITPMAETQLHGNRESTSEDTLHTTVNLEALQQVKSAESPAILLHNPNRLKITLNLQRCCPISFFFFIMAFKLHCVRLYFFFFFIFLPFNKCDN